MNYGFHCLIHFHKAECCLSVKIISHCCIFSNIKTHKFSSNTLWFCGFPFYGDTKLKPFNLVCQTSTTTSSTIYLGNNNNNKKLLRKIKSCSYVTLFNYLISPYTIHFAEIVKKVFLFLFLYNMHLTNKKKPQLKINLFLKHCWICIYIYIYK